MPYKNPEDLKARNRRYYQAHKAHLQMVAKKWVVDNYEHVLEIHRAYRKAHPDKQKEYRKRWRTKHREQHLASERARRWRKVRGLKNEPKTAESVKAAVAKAETRAKLAKYGIQQIGNYNP